jgi:hypothetical protein
MPDSIEAQALRDTGATWAIGTTVATGYIPLPIVDWRAGLKALGGLFLVTRNNVWVAVGSLFTETIGNVFGVGGADFEMIKKVLKP